MKSFLQRQFSFFPVLTLIVMVQFSGASWGETSQDQREQINRIQDYLNGIHTLRADFTQHNPDGSESFGKFYLKRRGKESFGKLRLEYAPPTLTKIIANGEVLLYEDGNTKEVSEYPIDSTPASFLLRHKIDFFDDLEVKTIEVKESKIYLTVSRAGDESSFLTLVFSTSPMLRLQEWTVVDEQANKTHVILANVEIGISLDEKLFQF